MGLPSVQKQCKDKLNTKSNSKSIGDSQSQNVKQHVQQFAIEKAKYILHSAKR